jgi:hypothetical protein
MRQRPIPSQSNLPPSVPASATTLTSLASSSSSSTVHASSPNGGAVGINTKNVIVSSSSLHDSNRVSKTPRKKSPPVRTSSFGSTAFATATTAGRFSATKTPNTGIIRDATASSDLPLSHTLSRTASDSVTGVFRGTLDHVHGKSDSYATILPSSNQLNYNRQLQHRSQMWTTSSFSADSHNYAALPNPSALETTGQPNVSLPTRSTATTESSSAPSTTTMQWSSRTFGSVVPTQGSTYYYSPSVVSPVSGTNTTLPTYQIESVSRIRPDSRSMSNHGSLNASMTATRGMTTANMADTGFHTSGTVTGLSTVAHSRRRRPRPETLTGAQKHTQYTISSDTKDVGIYHHSTQLYSRGSHGSSLDSSTVCDNDGDEIDMNHGLIDKNDDSSMDDINHIQVGRNLRYSIEIEAKSGNDVDFHNGMYDYSSKRQYNAFTKPHSANIVSTDYYGSAKQQEQHYRFSFHRASHHVPLSQYHTTFRTPHHVPDREYGTYLQYCADLGDNPGGNTWYNYTIGFDPSTSESIQRKKSTMILISTKLVARFVACFSGVGALFLYWVGYVLDSQPLFIKGVLPKMHIVTYAGAQQEAPEWNDDTIEGDDLIINVTGRSKLLKNASVARNTKDNKHQTPSTAISMQMKKKKHNGSYRRRNSPIQKHVTKYLLPQRSSKFSAHYYNQRLPTAATAYHAGHLYLLLFVLSLYVLYPKWFRRQWHQCTRKSSIPLALPYHTAGEQKSKQRIDRGYQDIPDLYVSSGPMDCAQSTTDIHPNSSVISAIHVPMGNGDGLDNDNDFLHKVKSSTYTSLIGSTLRHGILAIMNRTNSYGRQWLASRGWYQNRRKTGVRDE